MEDTQPNKTTRKRSADVPGLLLGDLLYSSEPSRQNETDARLVLRMAMTGVMLETRSITQPPNLTHNMHE